MLFAGFQRLSPTHLDQPSPMVFSKLITGFQVAVASDRPVITISVSEMREMLDSHSAATQLDDVRQEHTADDFNIMSVFRLTGDENRHSMALAWLLDRNLRKHGTHAQGAIGLKLFLQEFDLPTEYARAAYYVRREVAGKEARVDLEIACRGHFLIHIENKIWSDEGPRQTDREWEDIQRRASALNVISTSRVHALFLTLKGDKPKNRNFIPISWRQVARVFDEFSTFAKPAEVKMFASHYARTLGRFI